MINGATFFRSVPLMIMSRPFHNRGTVRRVVRSLSNSALNSDLAAVLILVILCSIRWTHLSRTPLTIPRMKDRQFLRHLQIGPLHPRFHLRYQLGLGAKEEPEGEVEVVGGRPAKLGKQDQRRILDF